ncbi:MAG: hypothetical protein ACE5IR_27845 [bacterium]
MPRETKANKAEVERRTTVVVDLLLDGLRRHEILKYIEKNENWGISNSQTDEYIAKANEVINNYESGNRDAKIKKTEQRLEKLLSRAISKKDFRLARLLIQDIRTLFGIDRPIKIAPTTPDGENEFTGISEARQAVEEEISRLLAGVNNNANGKKLAKASNGTASKK